MKFEYHRVTGDKMIGYLRGEYPQGEVPTGFLEKLIALQKSDRIGETLTAGHHTCEYCFPGGDNELNAKIEAGEIEPSEELFATVCSSGDYYLGEYVWPHMLLHYVRDHHYLPEEEFTEFIMNFDLRKVARKDNDISVTLPPFDF